MKTIKYRVQFTGATKGRGERDFLADADAGAEYELVTVQARDINSGYPKAVRLAMEPLGNGTRREVGSITFWEVV